MSETYSIYDKYLQSCFDILSDQEDKVDELINKMIAAHAIHILGFGRSGCSALSFAIRLRHFKRIIPPVWWIGDLVREPIRNGDLIIIFSLNGERAELIQTAELALSKGAEIDLITAKTGSSLAGMASYIVYVPLIESGSVYGGGDFEVAVYLLQEIILNHIGAKYSIPYSDVTDNHI